MRNLFKWVSKLRLALHLLLFLMITGVSVSQAQPNGEEIFKANCKSCHTIGKGPLIGPDLKDVETRAPDRDWLVKWITNSQELVKAGDGYAVEVFNANKGTIMPPQAVNKEEINAILDYIKDYKPPVEQKVVDEKPTEAPADNTLLISLAIACAVLLLVIWFLRSTKSALQEAAADKIPLPARHGMGVFKSIGHWITHNKRSFALIVLLLVALGMRQLWYSAIWIGVHQGYEPIQPIAFPHDLHAGKNGINCVYCHSGAEKSKTAGIPSLNVCMNCHKFIKEGSRTGTTEIAKIYKYLDYDPETGEYGDNPQPVQWVKVHNLPDLAYFNHSQHVVVGKLPCQRCHGKVEEMQVLHQESTLVMGWCIDCHRNEPVKMEGNPYYDHVHDQLTEEQLSKFMKDGKITVEELGGTECARCHY